MPDQPPIQDPTQAPQDPTAPEASSEPLPFDAQACEAIRDLHALLYHRHPEIRSVATVIDYFGELNDANIQKGVWSERGGNPPSHADSIMGSLFQTLRLVDEMQNRSIQLSVALRSELQELLTEQLRIRREHEARQAGQQEAAVPPQA